MPNRDDVIKMVESVGVKEYGPLSRNWSFKLSQLERFAQLVAAHEREQIIASIPGGSIVDPQWVCDMIRSRGNA